MRKEDGIRLAERSIFTINILRRSATRKISIATLTGGQTRDGIEIPKK